MMIMVDEHSVQRGMYLVTKYFFCENSLNLIKKITVANHFSVLRNNDANVLLNKKWSFASMLILR